MSNVLFQSLESRVLFSALFGAVKTFPTGGSGSGAMATADFNGDGLPDVAVANYNDGTVTVFLNKGAGQFTALKPFSTKENGLSSIAIGDFNGDNKPDIAAVGSDLEIFTGLGGGKFSGPVTYSAGGSPQNVIVADFNGDKKPDLAVTDVLGDAVLIYKNTGAGKFTQTSTIGGIPGAAGIVAGDFNGDKKLDLAVTSFGHLSFSSTGALSAGPSDGVRLLIGDGKGDFTLGAKFKVYGTRPTYIAAADFNGDGNLDLVTTDGGLGGLVGTSTVSVIYNYGHGHFAYPKIYSTGGSPQYVTVADVNGDGHPDIITGDYLGGDISVITYKSGPNYFNKTITFPTSKGATDVLVLDVNNDKKLDLLSDSGVDNVLDVLLG